MPDFWFDVDGADDVDAALAALERRIQAATRRAVKDGLRLVQRRGWAQLSRYSHPPGTPTPSPPGQPPAVITGHLRGSLTPRGPFAAGGGFAGEIGPTAVYGRIQELGGVTGRNHATTLPARPYLKPTLRQARSDGALRRTFADAWRRAL